MHVDITGRHVDITPALREFAEEKIGKLRKLLDGPLEVHVVLEIEKHRHIAEIQIKSRTVTLSGTQETGDLYASIGEVVDKLERQALKHKEKRHDHKHRGSPRDPQVAAVIEANAAPSDSGEDAVEARGSRIVRTPGYRIKPLTAEDAAMELEGSDREVLVFRDSTSDRVSVVFRRRDGNVGLIEPEY